MPADDRVAGDADRSPLTPRANRITRWPVARRLKACFLICLAAAGCSDLRYDNTAQEFDRPFDACNDSVCVIWFKTSYLYPCRDIFGLTWLGRLLLGDEAWNVDSEGGVADGPFFVNRDIQSVTPEQARAGAAVGSPPVGPWKIKRRKQMGVTPGFIGTDAEGRTFLVKLDDIDFPELGTSTEIIGSRIFWLLGYRVPPISLVTIDGTGDPRFDGRRATASLFVQGDVLGGFSFDHFRMRREIRALRLVGAWLNDTDRGDNNTLVSVRDGRAECYFVDFNSCLGSWNGRPKAPWRGWRHAWDVEYQLLGLFTLGLLPDLPTRTDMHSPGIGTLDLLAHASARRWRPQFAHTGFDRVTPSDADWIARRIAAVSRAQLEAVVAAAEFSRAEDAESAMHMLLERRRRVLESWGFGQPASASGGPEANGRVGALEAERRRFARRSGIGYDGELRAGTSGTGRGR